MKLLIASASPFVRKVRVMIRELDIAGQRKHGVENRDLYDATMAPSIESMPSLSLSHLTGTAGRQTPSWPAVVASTRTAAGCVVA